MPRHPLRNDAIPSTTRSESSSVMNEGLANTIAPRSAPAASIRTSHRSPPEAVSHSATPMIANGSAMNVV